MIPSFSLLLYLVQLVQASSTNATIDDPPCGGTSASYRSIGTILTSCGLTLLICVWNTVHPDLLPPRHKWYQGFLYRALLVIIAFIIPEFIVERAYVEWKQARSITNRFRDKGYEWTMTHSYFTLMGGFVLRDHKRTKELGADDILDCFENKMIANPAVNVEDITDKSSSDELAKVILLVQLCWFILQIIVRGAKHLAITLVEVDTLCLAVITFPIFFFWWGKPRGAARPYVFYSLSAIPFDDPTPCKPSKGNWISTLSGLGITPAKRKGETNSLMSHNDRHHIDSDRTWSDLLYLPKALVPENSDIGTKDTAPLFIAWMVFGALHMIASNFAFPSSTEKMLWFIMSLSLVAVSGQILVVFVIHTFVDKRMRAARVLRRVLQSLAFYFFFIGVGARVSLVVLMVRSLPHLPASAYQTIPWTVYIPHL